MFRPAQVEVRVRHARIHLRVSHWSCSGPPQRTRFPSFYHHELFSFTTTKPPRKKTVVVSWWCRVLTSTLRVLTSTLGVLTSTLHHHEPPTDLLNQKFVQGPCWSKSAVVVVGQRARAGENVSRGLSRICAAAAMGNPKAGFVIPMASATLAGLSAYFCILDSSPQALAF